MRSYIVIAVDEEPPGDRGVLVAGSIRRRVSETARRTATLHGVDCTDMIFREDRATYPSLPTVDVAGPFLAVDKAYRDFLNALRAAVDKAAKERKR